MATEKDDRRKTDAAARKRNTPAAKKRAAGGGKSADKDTEQGFLNLGKLVGKKKPPKSN